MTALSLRAIVTAALADIGVVAPPPPDKSRVRKTDWLPGGHGIGLRHYTSGRRVYVAQSRMGGRVRTVTIGPASVITEAQAITVARRILAHAFVGNDPAETRKRVRAAPTWPVFLDEYWRAASPGWKPSTRKSQAVYRRCYLDPAFADLTIDVIAQPEVTRWFARTTQTCGSGGANRCLSILNAMMVKAECWGYREEGSNPCRRVKRNRMKKLERYLSEPELVRLGAVLAAARASPDATRQTVAGVITLLLLTGCRRGEILKLRWADIRGQRIRLAEAKAGPRTVWLGAEARAVIDGLPRTAKSTWLFPGRKGPLSGCTLASVWSDIRSRADLVGVRIHDLRHTFASHAAQAHETLPMIGKLLGHASLNSTARYAHLDDAGVMAENERVGKRLVELLDV